MLKRKKKKANPNSKRGQNPTITSSVSTSWLHHDRCPPLIKHFLGNLKIKKKKKKVCEKKETFLLSKCQGNKSNVSKKKKRKGNFQAGVFALVGFEQFQLLILLSLSIYNYIPSSYIIFLFSLTFPENIFPYIQFSTKPKPKPKPKPTSFLRKEKHKISWVEPGCLILRGTLLSMGHTIATQSIL